MGHIIYGSGDRLIEVDDRTLAHVKTVVVMKLRRNESFLLTWVREVEGVPRRMSLWLHPSIPLQFEFETAERIERNKAWLEELMRTANVTGDLDISAEPLHLVHESTPSSAAADHEQGSLR